MPMDPVDRGEAREDTPDTPERLKLGGARLDVKSAECESIGGDDEERRARRDVAPTDPLPRGPACRCTATAAAAFPASPCRRRA